MGGEKPRVRARSLQTVTLAGAGPGRFGDGRFAVFAALRKDLGKLHPLVLDQAGLEEPVGLHTGFE